MSATANTDMSEQVKVLIRLWVATRHGNREQTAAYMRDVVRVGGIRECRALIARALEGVNA